LAKFIQIVLKKMWKIGGQKFIYDLEQGMASNAPIFMRLGSGSMTLCGDLYRSLPKLCGKHVICGCPLSEIRQ
jgi:hypothetical protein